MSAASAASELVLDLPSRPSSVTSARHAVTEWAAALGVSTGDIALAVSEAVANAVMHAFQGRAPGTISVHASRNAKALVVTVADDGIGMTPNLESPGLGMGVSLISKLASDVHFDSSDRGTTIAMSFDLDILGGMG
jgi:anti-sigma regulatory factor (Ser/Thr protein kinase)